VHLLEELTAQLAESIRRQELAIPVQSASPARVLRLLRRPQRGYRSSMDATTTIDEVRTSETRGGNTRYVVRDAEGKEYTTFREAIGEAAMRLEGTRVRIYLDKVEALAEPAADDGAGGARAGQTDTDPEEVAWRTAVEAAPWLVGESDPHAKTAPEELYETLKPFKDKVAEDIKRSNDEDDPTE
jgi:hypothetical protein